MQRFRRMAIPRVSLATHIVGVVVVCVLASVIVAFDLHRPARAEAVIEAEIVAAVFTAYFTVILYRGVRFDRGDVHFKKSPNDRNETLDAARDLRDNVLSNVDFDVSGFDVSGFSELGGCLGFLLTIIVSAIGVVVLLFCIWAGLELAWPVVVAVAIPLYAIFRASARLVIVHTRRCRGKFTRALAVGCGYGVAYTALIAGVFFAIDRLIGR